MPIVSKPNLFGNIQRQLDAIIDFADIGPFIDVQVRNYSSGMVVRLSLPESPPAPPASEPERPRGTPPEPRKGLRLLGERPAEPSPGSAPGTGEERK